jgi:hypothetical protein
MNAFVLVAAAVALFALAQKQKSSPGTTPVKPELPSPFPDKPKPPSEQPTTPPAIMYDPRQRIREPTAAEMQAALLAKDFVLYDVGDETVAGTYYKLFTGASPAQGGGVFRFANLAVAVEQGFYVVARDAYNPKMKPAAGYPWKYYVISAAYPMQLLVEDTSAPRWAIAITAAGAPLDGNWVRVTSTGLRRVRDALGVA